MGSAYDGAEVCELVGLFVLNILSQTFGKENVGLYRDDGRMIVKRTSGRTIDKARKDHFAKCRPREKFRAGNFKRTCERDKIRTQAKD